MVSILEKRLFLFSKHVWVSFVYKAGKSQSTKRLQVSSSGWPSFFLYSFSFITVKSLGQRINFIALDAPGIM